MKPERALLAGCGLSTVAAGVVGGDASAVLLLVAMGCLLGWAWRERGTFTGADTAVGADGGADGGGHHGGGGHGGGHGGGGGGHGGGGHGDFGGFGGHW